MSKVLYNTKFLQLKSTPSKSGKPWVYAHRPNATDVVVIVPATDEEILFLIEERPPLTAENKGPYSIALPAGLVGDERENETTEEAIKAELLEETGLVANKIKIVSKNVASSPGCVSETVTIAIAYIESKKTVHTPITDGGIIIDRCWIKKSEIFDWLKKMESNGYILTAQTLAGLFYIYEEN